jgi:formate hydrogenlyase subunit 6/NADH:ubiquinone oxidoreductase subunit I
MVTLLNNLFKNLGRKAATRRYPFVKRELPPETRGHLDIEIDACIFCGACQKRCPANALAVTRTPKSWSVNHFACILCGHCVDVCPKKCLSFRTAHFPAN